MCQQTLFPAKVTLFDSQCRIYQKVTVSLAIKPKEPFSIVSITDTYCARHYVYCPKGLCCAAMDLFLYICSNSNQVVAHIDLCHRKKSEWPATRNGPVIHHWRPVMMVNKASASPTGTPTYTYRSTSYARTIDTDGQPLPIVLPGMT